MCMKVHTLCAHVYVICLNIYVLCTQVHEIYVQVHVNCMCTGGCDMCPRSCHWFKGASNICSS